MRYALHLGGMAGYEREPGERPREWRRRVLVPARMRSSAGWSDARILNVSSRGLMIHASQSTVPGDLIEIRKDSQVIIARVVWKQGPRTGLHSDSILPLTEILSLSEQDGVELADKSADRRQAARKTDHRDAEYYRMRARIFEFVSIAAIAVSLAVSVAMMANDLLSVDFDIIGAALSA